MALSEAGLRDAIIAELDAVAPTADAENGDSGAEWRNDFASAVAKAVINYLKQNAEVHSLQPLSVTHPMGPGTVNPFTLPPGTTLQ